jgi:hypothetical protein
VISLPFAHMGGIPLEETLASLGPALLVGFGAAWSWLRAHLRGVCSRAGLHDHPHKDGRAARARPV